MCMTAAEEQARYSLLERIDAAVGDYWLAWRDGMPLRAERIAGEVSELLEQAVPKAARVQWGGERDGE